MEVNYNIVLVLPYINMNPPQVYTCFPFWAPLPPLSPYHPSGSSQCTSPKHPASCIEPGLALRFIYDIIHVSVPFTQIIPPSPSPIESKRLFYTSVHLLKENLLLKNRLVSRANSVGLGWGIPKGSLCCWSRDGLHCENGPIYIMLPLHWKKFNYTSGIQET